MGGEREKGSGREGEMVGSPPQAGCDRREGRRWVAHLRLGGIGGRGRRGVAHLRLGGEGGKAGEQGVRDGQAEHHRRIYHQGFSPCWNV